MHLVLKGKPIQQVRHRHRLLYTGRVHVYDPLAREKALIRFGLEDSLSENLPEFQPFKNPRFKFVFYMPIPKYLRKEQRTLAEKELLRHLVKPDVDNLIKFYFDVFNKIIIDDDRSASIEGAEKIYSPHPRTDIIVSEAEPVLSCSIENVQGDAIECDGQPISTIHVPPYCESPHYSGL